MASAKGAYYTDTNGKEIFDGLSGLWTCGLGHGRDEITAAVSAQMTKLDYSPGFQYGHELSFELANKVVQLTPSKLDHVFFTDSGSETVDTALKMARGYWRSKGQPGKSKFIGRMKGYHGVNYGGVGVGGIGFNRKLFGQSVDADQIGDTLLEENKFSRGMPSAGAHLADELEELVLLHDASNIAAVIVEPLVQCAGGMKMHAPETLTAIAAAAKDAGVLLICDEIAVNFGRTGTLFAHTQAGIAPDIICLGKALTGGAINLAATVATADVFEAFLSDEADAAFMHGPTYMATPLACAAANASLDLFDSEPRLQQVAAIEAQLKRELEPLRALPGVVDVRVKGAIGAVEVTELHDLDWLKAQFVEAGIWLRPFGKVIYTMPPFTITSAELSAITGAIAEILPRWAARKP